MNATVDWNGTELRQLGVGLERATSDVELARAIGHLGPCLGVEALGAVLPSTESRDVLLVACGLPRDLIEGVAAEVSLRGPACVVTKTQALPDSLRKPLEARGLSTCVVAQAHAPGHEGRLVGFVSNDFALGRLELARFEAAGLLVGAAVARISAERAAPPPREAQLQRWLDATLALHEAPSVLVDDEGVVQALNPAAEALSEVLRRGVALANSWPDFPLATERDEAKLVSHGGTDYVVSTQRLTDATVVTLTPSATQAERRQLASSSERLQTLGALAATLAHDLNNMLLPLVLSADALSATATNATVTEEAHFIVDSAARAAAMVREMIDYARGSAAAPSPVDVEHSVLRGLRYLRRILPPSVNLITDLRRVPPVIVNENDLVRALVNLGVNAKDAMCQGGTLMVTVREHHVDTEEPGAFSPVPAGNWVAVEVHDSGHGIEAARFGRLFKRFETTKTASGGTGLGLAMVRDMLERAGGAAQVESSPGRGTVIRLFLRTA